jgi:hypothetical protein
VLSLVVLVLVLVKLVALVLVLVVLVLVLVSVVLVLVLVTRNTKRERELNVGWGVGLTFVGGTSDSAVSRVDGAAPALFEVGGGGGGTILGAAVVKGQPVHAAVAISTAAMALAAVVLVGDSVILLSCGRPYCESQLCTLLVVIVNSAPYLW